MRTVRVTDRNIIGFYFLLHLYTKTCPSYIDITPPMPGARQRARYYDNVYSSEGQSTLTNRATPVYLIPPVLRLPTELLVYIFGLLVAEDLAHTAATCTDMFYDPMSPVALALELRAAEKGRVYPTELPHGVSSRAAHLAWLESLEPALLEYTLLESRRDEAWAPVAIMVDGENSSALVVTDGGRVWRNDDAAEVAPPPIRNITAGSKYIAAVAATGAVYTWGTGPHGHGGATEVKDPTCVIALSRHRVLSVSAGYSHCLAVTESGAVFSWGANACGQCGHGISTDLLLPLEVECFRRYRARSVSAGDMHSLVVTEDGALCTFGQGVYGQLGHGTHGQGTNKHSPAVVVALRHERIASVAAGSLHSLARTEDGVVFAWGSNDYGQLGLGPGREGITNVPKRISGLLGAVYVAAGGASSCAIDREGMLLTWGDGEKGELGRGGDEISQYVPTRVDRLGAVRLVSIAVGHTVAVMTDGTVYTWGTGSTLGAREPGRLDVVCTPVECD